MRSSCAACEDAPAGFVRIEAIVEEPAQRLLVERRARSVRAGIEALAREGPTPQAKLHALYTLEGMGELTSSIVETALDDPHFAVRLHADALGEPDRWTGSRRVFVNSMSDLFHKDVPPDFIARRRSKRLRRRR